jgi:hypothetical protein
MSFTVTATQLAIKANGLAVALKVLTGAAAAQPGATAGNQGTACSQAITPSGTGSWVYGAALGGNTTLTALAASTPFIAQVTQNSLRYIQLRSTSATTSGSAVTLGASSATTGLDLALCEILAAAGQTLTEDASAPATAAISSAQFLATAAFTPPAGSLLVFMISSNGGTGTTTVGVTDTSGLGLTWVERSKQNGGNKGYAGVWTAQVPGVKASGMIPFWDL